MSESIINGYRYRYSNGHGNRDPVGKLPQKLESGSQRSIVIYHLLFSEQHFFGTWNRPWHSASVEVEIGIDIPPYATKIHKVPRIDKVHQVDLLDIDTQEWKESKVSRASITTFFSHMDTSCAFVASFLKKGNFEKRTRTTSTTGQRWQDPKLNVVYKQPTHPEQLLYLDGADGNSSGLIWDV